MVQLFLIMGSKKTFLIKISTSLTQRKRKVFLWLYKQEIYRSHEKFSQLKLDNSKINGSSFRDHSVPELDLRKNVSKVWMAHVFRNQFLWPFQNCMSENPSIRDSWVNSTNLPIKTLKKLNLLGCDNKHVNNIFLIPPSFFLWKIGAFWLLFDPKKVYLWGPIY